MILFPDTSQRDSWFDALDSAIHALKESAQDEKAKEKSSPTDSELVPPQIARQRAILALRSSRKAKSAKLGTMARGKLLDELRVSFGVSGNDFRVAKESHFTMRPPSADVSQLPPTPLPQTLRGELHLADLAVEPAQIDSGDEADGEEDDEEEEGLVEPAAIEEARTEFSRIWEELGVDRIPASAPTPASGVSTPSMEGDDLHSLAVAAKYVIPDGYGSDAAAPSASTAPSTAPGSPQIVPGIDSLEGWEASLMTRSGEGFRRAQESRTREQRCTHQNPS